jgi:hypothetical protein
MIRLPGRISRLVARCAEGPISTPLAPTQSVVKVRSNYLDRCLASIVVLVRACGPAARPTAGRSLGLRRGRCEPAIGQDEARTGRADDKVVAELP